MSITTISLVPEAPQVNPVPIPQPEPESVNVHRLRRLLKNHNLRLVRDRSKGDWPKRYQLQSCVIVAGENFDLTLEQVSAIRSRLEGGR